MRRDIKFRGKRLDNGEWVYGHYLKLYSRIFIIDKDSAYDITEVLEFNLFYEVDPETVGQYIGIEDKNGEEIYEGSKFLYGVNEYYVVWWTDGFALDDVDSPFVIGEDGWKEGEIIHDSKKVSG